MFQPELRCVSSMLMYAYVCMLEKAKILWFLRDNFEINCHCFVTNF